MRRAGEREHRFATHPATNIQLIGLEPDTAVDVLNLLGQAGYWNTVLLPSTPRLDLAEEVTPGVVMVGVGAGSTVHLDAVRSLFEARAAAVRVIAVSPYPSLRLRAAALEAGASAFLTLPAERHELLSTVHVIAELHSAHRELSRLKSFPLSTPVDPAVAADRSAHAETTMLHRLMKLIDKVDGGLGKHSRRVAHLAARTAAAMDLPWSSRSALQAAARAHDLGKLVIPRSVINATGKLGYGDIAVMRSHARIGANMLTGAEGRLVCLAREVAASHHEWWDGGGYPRGLKGEEIPLEVRVVSVADAYDAMTNQRTYREALTRGEARKELDRGAGTQFDPEVVAAFSRVLDEEVVVEPS
jgi:putative two-component system response regulator